MVDFSCDPLSLCVFDYRDVTLKPIKIRENKRPTTVKCLNSVFRLGSRIYFHTIYVPDSTPEGTTTCHETGRENVRKCVRRLRTKIS